MTATTGRTVLALVAILSLLMSALMLTPTAALAVEHCPDHENVFKHEIDNDGGDGSYSTVINGTTVYYVIDGNTVSFYADAAHTIPMQTEFCMKGSTENSGVQTGTSGTFGQLSYFVIYEVFPPQPELEIEKSASATSVNAGDPFTYTITVENTGDADATGVVITDDLDDSLTVDSAAFSVDGGSSTDCTVGAGNTISCDVGTLAPASVATASIAVTTSAESCDEVRNTSTVDSNEQEPENSDEVVVGVVCEDLGSITVNKELEECVSCEAFTPGYWFNRGGGGGVDWANEWLGANPQIIAGISDADGFGSVAEVQAYLDWDVSGGDGANGLSATGQLLRHYLALVLNVAFADANDCDLAVLEYEGTSIAVWLEEALAALESATATDAEKEEIKDALDAINNSDAGDGTLECPSEGTGGSVAGFTFTLWTEGEGGLEVVDEMTTGESGSVTFSGLPLDTYVITETGPEGLECTIVSAWLGEEELEVVEGMITVTLTEENADLTITVVNDCEQPGEEDEFGQISIVKSTDPEGSEESFTFEATWDSDGFTLMDGELEGSGDLLAGEDYTITEVLTAEQMAAGWSLDDLVCEGTEAYNVSGTSVTITLAANDEVTCTFTNELEEEDEEEGELEIIKFFCPTVGEDQIFVFGPLAEEPIEFGVQGVEEEEELPSTQGCTLGAPGEEALGATFTITGGDLLEPWVVMTTWNEILTLELAPGEYTIVEEGTGLTADFTIADESDTAVVVFNYEDEEEAEEGRLKILKIYCVGQGEPVFTIVDGDASVGDVDLPAGCASPQPGDATFTLTMGESTSGEFTLGSDGARLIPLDVGTYTLNEVEPNEASSDAFEISADETTTAIVFNFAAEGEQPGGGPGQGETPREGTQGGNPLPNTATSPIPTGSVPAALLALLMLAGLGAAGYAVRAEAQRRR